METRAHESFTFSIDSCHYASSSIKSCSNSNSKFGNQIFSLEYLHQNSNNGQDQSRNNKFDNVQEFDFLVTNPLDCGFGSYMQPQALLTSTSSYSYDIKNWYLDTEATHQFTSDAYKF